MTTVLVVFFFSVQSSYAQNTEFDATEESFDTVQVYCADGTCWRIKTYATDQDVHVWNIGDVKDIVTLARANTEKNYGDLTEGYILESETGLDGIRAQLVQKGLSPTLEVSGDGFAFWAPAGTKYRSKSHPENR